MTDDARPERVDGEADFYVEPTGRADEWAWQVVRRADGVIVGFHRTRERADSYAAKYAAEEVA